MNEPETEILRRRIKLKGRALKLIRAEMRMLQHQLNLYKLKADLEGCMGQDFNLVLSQQIAAVLFLLEAMNPGARSSDPCGSDTLTVTFGAPSLSGKEHGKSTS